MVLPYHIIGGFNGIADSSFVLNIGQDIQSTDYFDTAQARQGMFKLSLNAGAIRLLVPDVMHASLQEMAKSQSIAISIGVDRQFPQYGKAAEIIFDDKTVAPFSLQVFRDMISPYFPKTDGQTRPFTVWTRGANNAPQCILTRKAKCRDVRTLPCMNPWW